MSQRARALPYSSAVYARYFNHAIPTSASIHPTTKNHNRELSRRVRISNTMAIRPITGVSTHIFNGLARGGSIRKLELWKYGLTSSRCSEGASSLTSVLPLVSDITLQTLQYGEESAVMDLRMHHSRCQDGRRRVSKRLIILRLRPRNIIWISLLVG
jgi:hypothetical protein